MAQGKLYGKKVMVTGGTRGIGYAIAKRLLEEGAEVAICGRTEEGVARAVANLGGGGGKIWGAAADVKRIEDIRKFFDRADDKWGSLDILVNNAGVGIFRSVAAMTPEEWNQVIDTNLNSVFHFSRAALERFRRAGGGFIVNISSLAAKNPFATGAAYNASKFGLNGFSEAMMLDHRYDNVRVCSIMPGSVATDFGSGGGEDWKIAAEDIAETVLHVVTMPARTLISRVEIRPSKPRK